MFASLGPEQIANRTQAIGARHLRYFLDYAVRGEAALIGAVDHDPSREVDSPFEASVRDALREHRVGHDLLAELLLPLVNICVKLVSVFSDGEFLVVVDGVAANVWRPKQRYGCIEARLID